MMQDKTKVLGIVAVVLILGLGIFFYNKKHAEAPSETMSETPTTTQKIVSKDGVTAAVSSTGGDYTIEQVPVTTIVKPVLASSLTFTSPIDPTAKAILLDKFKKVQFQLTQTPQDLNSWIMLGTYYKMAGDYDDAIKTWEYVSAMSPTNVISFSNLGNLYHYYLKDFPKAETNLKRVVANDPTYIVGYKNLFDLYHLSYLKETSKAEDILKQGIAKNGKAVDLMVTLALYYVEKGSTDKARSTYEQALAIAKSFNNTSLINSINEELAKLK
jgi:tetratricopeptide (TPR) repeat protein